MKNTPRSTRRAIILASFMMVAAILLRRPPAFSQGTGVTQVMNEFITAIMDNTNGDLGYLTTNGDPLSGADNAQQLVTTATTGIGANTSYATLRILEDQLGQPLSNTFRDMQIRHSGMAANGPAPTGGTGGGNITSTEMFNLVGSPGALGANGLIATFSASNTTVAGGPPGGIDSFRVVRTITMVRNQFELRFDVTNRDPAPRRAGLRILLDTRAGGAAGVAVNDGTPYFVPELGVISTEREFTAAANNIPQTLFTATDFANPLVLVQSILRGSAATTPDRVQIVDRTLLGNTLFDYQIDPIRTILNDSGYTVTWNPVVFRPGETRTYLTYFGLGFASGEYARPFVLGSRAPSQLTFLPGPDPLNPQPNQLGHHQPSEFTVTGHVFNVSTVSFGNINLNLNLPTGLELAPGESQSKTITTAGPNLDSSVTWRVRAQGIAAGDLVYSVSASVPAVGTKDVARTIGIPALPQDMLLGTDAQMVSFPYSFANPAPDQILFDQLTNAVLSPLRLATFEPRVNDYIQFPTDLTAINPGSGYWMRGFVATRLRLGSANVNPPQALSTANPFLIPLRAGWNMIGNPFLGAVFVGQLQVLANAQVLSLADAGNRQIVRPVLFFFQRGQGNVSADYVAFTRAFDQIVPRRGYWIFALQDCQLVVPPPSTIASPLFARTLRQQSAGGLDLSRGTGGNESDWRLRLYAASDEGRDFTTIGITPGAQDRGDANDLARPPAFDESVSVLASQTTPGKGTSRYALDVRSPFMGRKTWAIDVETNLAAPGPVSLSWPEIERLSRRVRFMLTDIANEQTVSMRLNHGYSFVAPAGPAVRRLRITVETGGSAGALRLTNLRAQVQPGAGASITFTSTKAATLDCVVLNAAGKIVGIVGNNLPINSGLNSIRWSVRNAQGLAVPRGLYVIQLIAHNEDGDRQTAIKSIQIP